MKKHKEKKNKHYTFVMVPHEQHQKMHSIKLPAKFVHGILFVFVFVAGFLIGSVFYNVLLTGKNLNYKIALSTSITKAKRIDYFEEESKKLKSAVLELHLRNNQLRELLGLRLNAPGFKITEVVDKDILKKLDNNEKTIYEALQEASQMAKADQQELKKLKKHVTEVYQKMAYLPSKWPVYGRIVSRYGYRRSPWRGMHTGVDIDSRYGYPIRATAPGVVTYAGWKRGYGKTVIIKHKYGFSSLYAHCSRLLVSKGDAIKANQFIARVGSTGLSTGSHVHYEIRKNNQPINPSVFLDLKVLTAARILK